MAAQTLYALAHARTGDKGNKINISLIAYRAKNLFVSNRRQSELPAAASVK